MNFADILFVSDYDNTMTGEQHLVPQENLDAIVNLAANTADGDHDLEQQLALIGAENISDDDMKRLKELARSIKDDEATLSQNLKLTSFLQC